VVPARSLAGVHPICSSPGTVPPDRTNVASYPAWQDWLREHQPPLQVVGGRYDPSFQVEEAEAYRRDVPDAEVHVLDAGHFALDEQPDLIADLTRRFLQRRQAHTDG
jgi:pimeloyl-ACP methyl ester carboxylesterase